MRVSLWALSSCEGISRYFLNCYKPNNQLINGEKCHGFILWEQWMSWKSITWLLEQSGGPTNGPTSHTTSIKPLLATLAQVSSSHHMASKRRKIRKTRNTPLFTFLLGKSFCRFDYYYHLYIYMLFSIIQRMHQHSIS